MNSEYGWKKDTSQYLSVDKDLSIASSDPDTRWIVVAYHSARYASISPYLSNVVFNTGLASAFPKPYEGTNYQVLSKEFVNTCHPLFDKYRVDLVLDGHVHNYQRSYPLKYESDSKIPLRTSTAKEVYIKPIGQIYLTVGTGGAEHEEVNPSANYWISALSNHVEPTDDYYIVKANATHYGFLELQFSADRKTLSGTFYGNDVLNKGSIVLNQFSIRK